MEKALEKQNDTLSRRRLNRSCPNFDKADSLEVPEAESTHSGDGVQYIR